jgi:26S proteasome regulatory subunit N8
MNDGNGAADDDETPHVMVKTGDIEDVTMHPLVLLSAADHYHRVARGTRKRVVGILLGNVFKGKVDATNSFAVPFEEDSKNPVRLANMF